MWSKPIGNETYIKIERPRQFIQKKLKTFEDDDPTQ